MLETLEKTDIKISIPKKYKVILHNDDTTSFYFVTKVLEEIFNKSNQEAYEIALSVHTNGKQVVGVYSKDIATTRIKEALALAKEQEQYEFLITLEEE